MIKSQLPLAYLFLLIAYWSATYDAYYLRRHGELVRDNGMIVWLFTKSEVMAYAKRHHERVIFR